MKFSLCPFEGNTWNSYLAVFRVEQASVRNKFIPDDEEFICKSVDDCIRPDGSRIPKPPIPIHYHLLDWTYGCGKFDWAIDHYEGHVVTKKKFGKFIDINFLTYESANDSDCCLQGKVKRTLRLDGGHILWLK
jgi:hypothetical protein